MKNFRPKNVMWKGVFFVDFALFVKYVRCTIYVDSMCGFKKFYFQTIFEINSTTRSQASMVMKEKRNLHNKVIKAHMK